MKTKHENILKLFGLILSSTVIVITYKNFPDIGTCFQAILLLWVLTLFFGMVSAFTKFGIRVPFLSPVKKNYKTPVYKVETDLFQNKVTKYIVKWSIWDDGWIIVCPALLFLKFRQHIHEESISISEKEYNNILEGMISPEEVYKKKGGKESHKNIAEERWKKRI